MIKVISLHINYLACIKIPYAVRGALM